jgi:8-oxo-dGTP pyrophosphatase MutT (NUDIX family)
VEKIEGGRCDVVSQEFSAGAVIYRKEGDEVQYLLLHGVGYWGFPKGNIEEGEEERETARREAEEESGLTDLRFNEFRETVHYTYRRKRELIHKEVVYFLAETRTKKICLSQEHDDCVWLPYEEALKRLPFKNSRELLKKAHRVVMEGNGE